MGLKSHLKAQFFEQKLVASFCFINKPVLSERNINVSNFLVVMIAGIDHQADITIYLEAEEVKTLGSQRLEGALIKTKLPKRQGTICLSLNDARKNENGFGIGINDKGYWGVQDGFCVEAFMGLEWYRLLLERGKVGLRQRMRDGSKIDVYDMSRLDEIDAMNAENLEFYRDNKERLPAEFG